MFITKEIQQLPLGSLEPYRNHLFKAYSDKRFSELVESIRANGVYSPIIVRSLDGGRYEILAGHNRTNAAKEAGLETIPALICEDLSEEEAEFVVIESNFLQRSIKDLSHTERANALAAHYDAIKSQGKRLDLLNQLESYIESDDGENSQDTTSRRIGARTRSDEKTAQLYGLSARNVQRYIRLSKLIKSLQERLDNDEFPFTAAVELAYLSENRQVWIEDALHELADDGGYDLDIVKAEQLRANEDSIEADLTFIKGVINGEIKPDEDGSVPAVRIGTKLLKKYDYFKTHNSPEEIEATIEQALELFFSQKKKK